MNKQVMERRLLDHAARFLARSPGASMVEIAESAGVGRATIHRYFPTRDVLIQRLALEAVSEVEALFLACELGTRDVLSDLRVLIPALVGHGDRLGFLSREPSLFVSQEVQMRADQLLEPLVALLEKGQREGYLARDLPASWMADVLLASIFAVWDAIELGRTARQDAERLVMRTVFHGIVETD